jgi:hypothetical protein
MALFWRHVFTVQAPDGSVGLRSVLHPTELAEEDFPGIAEGIAAEHGWPSCEVWLALDPYLVEAT